METSLAEDLTGELLHFGFCTLVSHGFMRFLVDNLIPIHLTETLAPPHLAVYCIHAILGGDVLFFNQLQNWPRSSLLPSDVNRIMDLKVGRHRIASLDLLVLEVLFLFISCSISMEM